MYTSSDDEDDGYYDNFIDEAEPEPTADKPSCDHHQHDDDGYYDNYISRGLCGTGPVNQQDFTIQDAVNIGLRPKYASDGHCWICPLGCLYVPRSHPEREKIQEELLLFANKVTHPVYTNLPFLNYHP